MKKILFLLLITISTLVFSQETPKVTLKDSTRLKLAELSINVNITGNFATTTYDMKFYNGLDRTLEGELAFPLGQGQSVSKFAMDLNGELREAAIVEKELARVAYETTIRQNIDPALLEKTNGNNYKARVYPILPKKFKRIVLTYEENLITVDGNLIYELPLGINESIDDFSLDITIFGTEKLPIVQSESFDLVFSKAANVMKASVKRKNSTPQKPVRIEIENPLGEEKVLSYQDYFYSYIPLKPESRTKKRPKKIALLWDASYSMRNRDSQKELKLLDMYFNNLQNVEVEYIAFNSTITNRTKFSIQNGNWELLKKELQSVSYDGGTTLEILQEITTNPDEILLFSDGLANLGKPPKSKKKPICTINSLTSANHFSLEKMATDSGGLYVNLGKLSAQKANELLQQEVLQFLGIKKNDAINETYPNQPTNIIGDFVLAGRFTSTTSVELLFGYRGKVTKTVLLNLDKAQNSDLVKRLWAKQKLLSLTHDREKNKQEIISLAKEYYLITDYTSMLILDRVEDYARYKIEPPKELRAQYKELLKKQEEEELYAEEDLEDRKEEIFEEYKLILDWHQSKFPRKKKKKKKQVQTSTTRNVTPRNQANRNTTNRVVRRIDTMKTDVDYSKRVIRGTVLEQTGEGLPGATIFVKGTNRGGQTDFDGKFEINAEQGEVLVFSYLGFETSEIQIGSSNTVNVKLKEAASVLDEILVVGDKTNMEQSVTLNLSMVKLSGRGFGVETNQTESVKSVAIRDRDPYATNNPMYIIDGVVTDKNPMSTLSSDDVDSMQVLKASDATKLYGSRASNGIVIINTKKGKETNKQLIEELNTKIEERIELKAWDPKTPYLDILRKESSTVAAYEKYLAIRDDYSNSPMFFIDVADFFDQKNLRPLAIRVLTNLVEIELENYELIKALAYKLEYFQQYDLAKKMYQKVLELRPEEPQSYRGLALACELAGDYQQSFDLLYKIYKGELLEKDEDERYYGIESIAFIELTRLVSKHGKKLKLNKHQRKFFKAIPVDIRIVIDWNHNDTDIDLWVIDPKKEKAFYRNTETAIGGRMSEDMTDGYGPEEFMLKNAIKGNYQIKVNYYADNVQKISGPTILKVTLFTNYGKKNEERKTSIVNLDKGEGTIDVGSLSFD